MRPRTMCERISTMNRVRDSSYLCLKVCFQKICMELDDLDA